MLKTQWGNIGVMAQEEAARVNTTKHEFIQVKRDATVAKDSFETVRANLKKKFSLGQIQLNALRSEASFASAKDRLLQQEVHGAPITSSNQSSRPFRVNSKTTREKQMLKQMSQKQRTQQQVLRRMIAKRIQATVNLTTAATSVFIADAAVSASHTAEKNVKELLSAVSTSVSNLNKEIGRCQLQLIELRRQRETYMGTAYKIITQQKLTMTESTYQFASMQHSVLSMASNSATEVFRIQTSISQHAATKYRVLRAREKLLLKFATYLEGSADKLKHAFVKSDTLARAETAAHNGASLAEFQHARSNVRGKHNNAMTNRTNNMQSSLSADTAIIAIVDAAQAAARTNAKTLRQQQRNAFTLAARLTLDAKAIRSKIPASLARIKQTMQNAKTAHTYADKMADKVHHGESVRHAYHTKLLQIRKEVEAHERSSSNRTTG